MIVLSVREVAPRLRCGHLTWPWTHQQVGGAQWRHDRRWWERFSSLLAHAAASEPGAEPSKDGLACTRAGPSSSKCHDPPSQLPAEEEHSWLGQRPWPQSAHVARQGERCLHVAGAPPSSGGSDSIECLHPVYCVHFTTWSSHHRITMWRSSHLTMPVSSSNN